MLKAEIQLDSNQLTVRLDIKGKETYEWLNALIHLTEDAYHLLHKED